MIEVLVGGPFLVLAERLTDVLSVAPTDVLSVAPTDVLVDRLAYVVAILLVGGGLFVLVDDEDLLKKVVGLNLFQTGIFLFLVVAAFRTGGRSPVVGAAEAGPVVDPLPHVLVLTAIVVGVSVTALAVALVVRIHAESGIVRAEDLDRASAGVDDRE